MKKLKTFCACAGLAAMLSVPALAAKQEFKVPEYDSKDVKEEKTIYKVITPNMQVKQINDPSEAKGLPLITMEIKKVDRNGDGRTDMIFAEIENPELKFSINGQKIVQSSYKLIDLMIDDDYDSYVDRILRDNRDKDRNLGFDGKYDECLKPISEEHKVKIEDIFK